MEQVDICPQTLMVEWWWLMTLVSHMPSDQSLVPQVEVSFLDHQPNIANKKFPFVHLHDEAHELVESYETRGW